MEVGQLWARMGLDKSAFSAGLTEANVEAGSFGGKMKTALSTLGTAAALGAGVALAAGLKQAVSAGIAYNATLENSKVAWTTLLGTEGKANDMLDRINKFAASTPFEKMGVDSMAKQLNNAGLQGDALFAQLTKFGDMAGAFGVQEASLQEMVRQYSQVKQAGVAYTEDLNILQDRGIPIYKAIAEQLHINVADVKKWASEGKISADIYQAALDKVAAGVAGGMQKQSESFTGMMSSFKDGLTQAAGLMAQDIFASLKGSLQGAMGVLDLFVQSLNSGNTAFQALGTVAQTYLGPVGGIFAGILNGVSAVFGFLTSNAELIKAGIIGLATAIGVFRAAAFAATIQSELHNIQLLIAAVRSGGLTSAQALLTAGTVKSTAAQKLLNLAMSANPVALVTTLIITLVTALIYLWNTNEGFRNAVIALWESLKTTVLGAITGLITGIKNFFGQIPTTVRETMNGAINFIKGINLFDIGKNMVQGLINGIKNMAGNLANSLKNIVGDAVSAAKKKLGIASPSKVFTEIGEYTAEGLAVGVDNKSKIASDAVRKMAGSLIDSVNFSGASLAGAGIGGGYSAANITIMLDGKTIAKSIGQPLMNEIRVKTGIKL